MGGGGQSYSLGRLRMSNPPARGPTVAPGTPKVRGLPSGPSWTGTMDPPGTTPTISQPSSPNMFSSSATSRITVDTSPLCSWTVYSFQFIGIFSYSTYSTGTNLYSHLSIWLTSVHYTSTAPARFRNLLGCYARTAMVSTTLYRPGETTPYVIERVAGSFAWVPP